jgi:hypothetical protein
MERGGQGEEERGKFLLLLFCLSLCLLCEKTKAVASTADTDREMKKSRNQHVGT